MIVPHAEIRSRVKEMYRHGLPKGQSTGWPSVDKHYTVGLSQWTLVTGNPNSGKSEWVDALMVNLAKAAEWRFYIYSPENHPLEIHHAKLIEKFIGKPFDTGPTQRLDEEELDRAESWIEGKFRFCKTEHPTLEGLISEAVVHDSDWAKDFATARKTLAQRPHKLGIVVDPWNQLEHNRPHGMTETEYVSQTLSEAISMTRQHNAHLWLVAHPAKLYRDKDGKYPVPTPRDVSGSVHFWNKSDACITVHRDQVEGSPAVDIHVQKVRFKHIGHIGLATLNYDRVTGRYHEKLRLARSYAERDE